MAKILLVEDDASLREIYSIRLTAEGFEIISAGNGEEALAVAVREKPDLILSDVMMPKISGFDMLDILRSTPETKEVKVIMMTALSSEDQRQRGESLGANRFLVKSQVGIEDVVNAVHEVIAGNTPAEETPTPEAAPAPEAPVEAPAPAEPAVETPAPETAPAPEAPAPAPAEPVAEAPVAETPVETPVPTPEAAPAPEAPVETPAPTIEVTPVPEAQEAPAPAAPTTPEITPIPTFSSTGGNA